jgi:hypothetical protein
MTLGQPWSYALISADLVISFMGSPFLKNDNTVSIVGEFPLKPTIEIQPAHIQPAHSVDRICSGTGSAGGISNFSAQGAVGLNQGGALNALSGHRRAALWAVETADSVAELFRLVAVEAPEPEGGGSICESMGQRMSHAVG